MLEMGIGITGGAHDEGDDMMDGYVGIDPGATGAAVILWDFPGLVDRYDWGSVAGVSSWLNSVKGAGRLHVALEHVHSMPKQGVKSMFSFGMNFGMWQGLLTAHGIPYQLVPPQTWAKGLLLKSDGVDQKHRALAFCERRFPDLRPMYAGMRGGVRWGVVDALCIAEWLRRQG